jgi:hypothetical protein
MVIHKIIIIVEDLKNLVRQHAAVAIINNPAIPAERNEEVVAEASSSIVAGLKTAVAGGNTDSVVGFFNGAATMR